MYLTEHISGTVSRYDYEAQRWTDVVILSDSNVISASTVRQCCPDGAFAIGGVFAGTLSLVCRLPGMGLFQVRGARITLFSQYNGEASPQQIGVFWVTNASRVGDIFTLDAQDAVGWTDTSSYNASGSSVTGGIGKYLVDLGCSQTSEAWMKTVTAKVVDLVECQTGIPNMLTWKDYDLAANDNERYCNQMIWARDDEHIYETIYPAMFACYPGSGASDSDCPRDFYIWLATLAGGFVHALPTGELTLGQFAQPEFGTAVIHTNEIELDTCDIADYTLQLLRVTVQSQLDATRGASMEIYTSPDYAHRVTMRYQIADDPFLDGFVEWYIYHEQTVPSVWTIAHSLWRSFTEYGGGVVVRPFRCTVHKAARYHLGQKIEIHWRGRGETSETVYQSTITGIRWTFRGGTALSCGGEDSRVMADAVRASKGDKALQEARNRCNALQREMGA